MGKLIIFTLAFILLINFVSAEIIFGTDNNNFPHINIEDTTLDGNVTIFQNITNNNITNNFIGGNATFNQTLTNSLYIFQSEEPNLNVNSSDFWDNLDTINSTQMENNGGVLNILESWFSSLFDTLFSSKDTDDLTEGSTNLYQNKSFNQTLTDSLYTDGAGGNLSWNESLADTLYLKLDTSNDPLNTNDLSLDGINISDENSNIKWGFENGEMYVLGW